MTGTSCSTSSPSLGVLGQEQLGTRPHSHVTIPTPSLPPHTTSATAVTPSVIICPSLLSSATSPAYGPPLSPVHTSPTSSSKSPRTAQIPTSCGSSSSHTLPLSYSSSSIITPKSLSLPPCLNQPSASVTDCRSNSPVNESASPVPANIVHGTPSSASPSAVPPLYSNNMTSTSPSDVVIRPHQHAPTSAPTLTASDLFPSSSSSSSSPFPSRPSSSSSAVSFLSVHSSSSAADNSSKALPVSSIVRQVVSAGVVSLTQLGMGAMEGFSSVTQHKLTATCTEDLSLSTTEYSLFSSVTYLGGMGGCLLSGFFMSKWGHRRSLLATLPFVLVAWLCLSFANSVPLLLGARGTLGFALGFMSPIVSLYIMEFAHSNYRGALSSSADLVRQCGYLFIYALGSSALSWRHLALVCGLVTTVPPFLGIFFLWDSPRWLVLNGRKEEALQSLTFFRGRGYDVTAELSEIILNIEGANSNDDNNNTPKKNSGKSRLGSLSSSSLSLSSSSLPPPPPPASSSSLCSQLSVLSDFSVLKRVLVLAVLMFAVQFTGNTAVASYTVDIFRDSGAGIDVHLSTILTGLIRVGGSVLLVFTVDRARRRVLFVAALLACSVCMAALGAYFYVKEDPEIFRQIFWLPLLAVLVFTLSVIYVSSIAGLFRNEILPNNFRSLGGSLLSLLVFTGAFTVPHTYYKLQEALNSYGVFWFYACCSAVAVFIPVFWLPETQGRSLEEIDEFFRRRSKADPPASDAVVSS